MEAKLKICIVSREYPPETLWGGIGTFTYNLAHGLKNIGHDVDVIAFSLHADSYANDNGINIHRICSPRLSFMKKSLWDCTSFALSPFALFYSYKVAKKFKELNMTKRYDVVDLPEHIGEGFFIVLANKLPTLVRLYTPLSLISHMGLNIATSKLDYFLFGLLEKISIKKATIVNSPSNALAEFVKDKFNLKRQIDLLYNPIDTNIFKPNAVPETGSITPLRVLFVGRFEDRKGIHILAEAIPEVVKKIPDVKFLLLGNDCSGVKGFKSMKEFMLQLFEKQGVLGNIEFLDRVPYDKLPEVYNGADISVVPSLYDNSPYTCLEAMSCGLPVIGTSAGGMPEYIDDGVNGIIVPPSDVGRLAGALIELLSDTDKRLNFGKSAREKAVNKFNDNEVAREITTLYLKALRIFNKSAQ